MNKRSEESKVAFEAAISAMRMSMRQHGFRDPIIEQVTKRARYIYAVSTLSIVAGFQGDDGKPPAHLAG